MKTVKISEGNSKTGKISSVSMTPVKSCGNCGSCKSKCYVLKYYKQYPNVRKAYDSNYELAMNYRAKYFIQIAQYLRKKGPKYFRFHISGDILDQMYLNSMISTAKNYPKTRFLCFTKMHSLEFKNMPDNLTVVLSMFPSMDKPKHRLPIAWYQDNTESRVPENAIHCPGNCETCGMCWELPKMNRDVVFNAH